MAPVTGRTWTLGRRPPDPVDAPTSIESIAAVIQLAVAPVFLLAGIAGMLNVLSIRLGRIVDRARVVETRMAQEPHEEHRTLLQSETEGLWKRIRLVNWALRMFVTGALLVCLVIMSLFVGEIVTFDLATIVAVLFVAAMCLVTAGLILFLFEVSVSTQRIRAGMTEILHESED